MTGAPVVICHPGQAGHFRSELYNQIVHWGTRLVESITRLKDLLTEPQQYAVEIEKHTRKMEEQIVTANQTLNSLVDGFRLPGFTPFKSDGDSHIDFILEKR
ncbi:MAG: hypothetical protein HY762_04685, partial [Planctomycetes bacterium]|nr:hypothetical protein [Planctomycetota bacterium]